MRPFVIARGFWRWLLLALGGQAIAMPWGRVYMREECFHDRATRFHELVHLRQVDRDGPLSFSLRYLWLLARNGYRANPYEIEAYALEAERYGPAGGGRPGRHRPIARMIEAASRQRG